MDLEKIRNRIRSNFAGKIFLSVLSIVYYSAFLMNKFFKKNIKPRKKFSSKIVCVGNISSGGTGKTTVVYHIANSLSKKGFKLAVVTRGYRSGFKKNEISVPDYDNISDFLNNEKVSDEHKVLAIMLKEQKIPVIASKNRHLAFRVAENEYKADFIISDDGFQNFDFDYFFSFVVINPNQMDDYLLPLGNLRETYRGIKRADAVIINHCELFNEEKIKKTTSKISNYISERKIFKASYEIEGFENPSTSKTYSLKFFSDREVCIFSAIGDNEQFVEYIKKTGAKPVKIWKYPDHYSYTEKDLVSIKNLSEGLPVITTVKDAVKILTYSIKIFETNLYITKIKMICDDLSDVILSK